MTLDNLRPFFVRLSVRCSFCGFIWKTKQDRLKVTVEHYFEVSITDSVAAFRSTPEASLVEERSGIDPDFREQSLTKRFVPARALSFFWDQKSFDPSSFSHICLP